MTAARLEKLREYITANEVDSVIVMQPENVRYFSGFTGDSTWLMVSPEVQILLTDFRYITQAQEETTGFEIVRQEKGLIAAAAEVARKHGFSSIGFEGSVLSYDNYCRLGRAVAKKNLTKSLRIDELRQVKDEVEIANIRQAASMADKAFADILDFIRPGMTEKEVALRLEQVMKENGSERPAFPTIVASGVRGALPHGVATDKVIAEGEFVTMDFGAVYNGYHSDMTRTVAIGQPTDEQYQVYSLVLSAQIMGIRAVKPQMSGKAVDKVARDYFNAMGYGEYFGHGLGHSVGLSVHEEPRLSPLSTCESLEPGMVVTVEPGLYIEGFGGVRIEDTVLVTETGHERLTTGETQIIEIKA